MENIISFLFQLAIIGWIIILGIDLLTQLENKQIKDHRRQLADLQTEILNLRLIVQYALHTQQIKIPTNISKTDLDITQAAIELVKIDLNSKSGGK